MKIKINVTANDIKNGKAEDCGKCPVALAVIRAFTNLKLKPRRVSVGGGDLEVCYTRNEFTFYTPQKVSEFIEKFDGREKVKPFSFFVTL